MRVLAYLLIGWMVLIGQSTLFAYMLPTWFQPDILLVLMVFLAITQSMGQGLPVALAYGYLLDLFSGSIPGAYLFQYVILFFIAHILRGRLLPSARLIQVLVVFSLSLLGDGILGLSATLFDVPIETVGSGGIHPLRRALTNAFLVLPIHPILIWIERRFFFPKKAMPMALRS